MDRTHPGHPRKSTRADDLRRQVEAAGTERERLAALIVLARHCVDLADGVRGLAAAKEARALALKLKDDGSAAMALCLASVAQFHRSEYVSAIASGLDAWDYATRGGSELGLAESHHALGFSLYAVGLLDPADRLVARGLERASSSPAYLETWVRLKRLEGILRHARGRMDEAERSFDEAIERARGTNATLLGMCYAAWGIAWIREMDEYYGGGSVIPGKLAQAREHVQAALVVAEEDGDPYLVADRTALLGSIAILEGHLDRAEEMLARAMESARALDYVRTMVSSTVYLGQVYLERGDLDRAEPLLRQAVGEARRGAPDDSLSFARLLLARVLERQGRDAEAGRERARVKSFVEEQVEARRRSGEEASKMIARILEDA